MLKSFSLPAGLVFRLAVVGILGRQRSFREDAAIALPSAPPIRLESVENIPRVGPFLVVMNHYNHPGIGVWWPVLVLSAVLPVEPHWVMTAAWTYSGWLRRNTLGPLTAWAFRRVARVYGFTNMPVMPPRVHEVADRTEAVRQVMRYARFHPLGVVGLAPEGHNTPDLSLGWPPAGSGRFMLGLAEKLGKVVPVGACWENEQLTLRVGPGFEFITSPVDTREQIDRSAARLVMEHIAALVPDRMRGEFRG